MIQCPRFREREKHKKRVYFREREIEKTSTRDIICNMYIYTASSTFGALLLWGWVLRGGERQHSRSFERSRFAHS